MHSTLYATIIWMVTLSAYDTIRHKNTVCYYPNNLLTWQRVLCVDLNVVVALYKTIYHHRSHPYQIDITPKTTCTRHVYFYSYEPCWRSYQIWFVMFGCSIIWYYFLLWVISRHFTRYLHVKRTQTTNILYDIFIIHVLVYWSFSCNYNVDVHFFYIVM